MRPILQPRTHDGTVEALPDGWRLAIPAGPPGQYRLAQLDDYMEIPRSCFPWQAPLRFSIRARVSDASLPGTWGFGLWNDPFSTSLGLGGMHRQLPTLPETAWFFYAGQPNYLALRDDHPAQGFLAAAFYSLGLPMPLLAPGALALPLLVLPPAARLLRRAARILVRDGAALITVDPTQWHTYSLELRDNQAAFFVDGDRIFSTLAAPRQPLGLVIWIDNQYAAFPPDGKIRVGTSANTAPAWIECADPDITDDLCHTND